MESFSFIIYHLADDDIHPFVPVFKGLMVLLTLTILERLSYEGPRRESVKSLGHSLHVRTRYVGVDRVLLGPQDPALARDIIIGLSVGELMLFERCPPSPLLALGRADC